MASMNLLVAGLVLFIGIHLVPTAPALRVSIASRMGEGPYKGLFSLVSATGLTLIVIGWPGTHVPIHLFAPLPAAHAVAPYVVTLAIVLFAAANLRTHIRARLRHPQLIGLLLWSGTHLLANGDLAGTVLFGSFAAYSIIAIVSAEQRHALKIFAPTWKHDAIAVALGLIASFTIMHFHADLFATAPVV